MEGQATGAGEDDVAGEAEVSGEAVMEDEAAAGGGDKPGVEGKTAVEGQATAADEAVGEGETAAGVCQFGFGLQSSGAVIFEQTASSGGQTQQPGIRALPAGALVPGHSRPWLTALTICRQGTAVCIYISSCRQHSLYQAPGDLLLLRYNQDTLKSGCSLP